MTFIAFRNILSSQFVFHSLPPCFCLHDCDSCTSSSANLPTCKKIPSKTLEGLFKEGLFTEILEFLFHSLSPCYFLHHSRTSSSANLPSCNKTPWSDIPCNPATRTFLKGLESLFTSKENKEILFHSLSRCSVTPLYNECVCFQHPFRVLED